jgi:sugar lactone lactonase YvrE
MKPSRIVFVLALLIAVSAQSQQYVISTYAGGSGPQAASAGYFGLGVATDTAGNVYFSSWDNPYCTCVFKLDKNGVVTRIAGNSQPGFSGDGGPATSALLKQPNGLAVDGAGNLFIADSANNRIRKVSPDGTITTVAGTGDLGYAQDGQPATSAPLNAPWSVAADSAGNVFIADTYFERPGGRSAPRILKVSPDGILTTAAGNGTCCGFSGDGGQATDAQLTYPTGLAVDGAGNLFIADGSVVRKVSPDGIITTAAGPGPPNPNPGSLNSNSDCVAGVSGDGGAATQAPLCYANNVAVDGAGNLFIVELMGIDIGVSYAVAVRKVTPDGTITTVTSEFLSWGGQAAVDGSGNLFVADGDSLRKISPDGIVTTVAGYGACCYSGDGGPASSAQLNTPHGLGVDGAGNLFIADRYNHNIRKVSPDGIITTVAGGPLSVHCLDFSGDSVPAASAQLCNPYNLAVDGAGNVFVADTYRVRRISPDGTITAVAGNGTSGYSGDGGPAIDAQLTYAEGVAVDGAGNLYILDIFRIRKVSPDGTITTLAGNGTYGYSGDGGPAIDAQMNAGAAGAAVDGGGNLFFLDSGRIRKVSPDGIVTTVAGNGKNSPGDGGPAANAQVSALAVAVDGAGNLFIADGSRVREISVDGIITTIAGNGTQGYSGDGRPATDAQLFANSVAVDGAGNVYIADPLHSVVRILRPIQ